jgi:hypothetical protein
MTREPFPSGTFINIVGPILTFSNPHSDAIYLSYSSSPLVNNRYHGGFSSAIALNSLSVVIFFFDDEELAFLFAGFLDGKEDDSLAADRRVVTMLDTNDVQWALDGRDVDETKSNKRKNFMPIDTLQQSTANDLFLLRGNGNNKIRKCCRSDGNSTKDPNLMCRVESVERPGESSTNKGMVPVQRS